MSPRRTGYTGGGAVEDRKEKPAPKTARLLKHLQKIADLPPADQRTVLKLLDALHAARRRTPRRRSG